MGYCFWNTYNLLTSAGGRFVDDPAGGAVEGEPTVLGTTLSFDVELDEPGDYAEFTVPVTNNGTIDAILSTVTTSIVGVDSDVLSLTVVDSGDTPLANGSVTLLASASENVTVRAEYRTDIDAVDLPVADTTITIEVSLLWEQN